MSLDSPEVIWWKGQIVPWGQAVVHVTSETAMRGTNVFEGLRAYWCPEINRFKIVALREHLERLRQSARMLGLPVDHQLPDLARGIGDLVKALNYCGNLYLRPTVYLEQGSYTAREDELITGTFIVARPTGTRNDQPISCAVSTWQRIPDTALPTLAKIGATYTAFRLARMEAAATGYDEAILLNARGTVAETGGAAVFVARNGRVSTPPLADGILDSITRRIVMELLSTHLSVSVTERSISRSELYSADEVFICGTLDEIRAVRSIDHCQLTNAPGKITQAVRSLYLDLCEGRRTSAETWWLDEVKMME